MRISRVPNKLWRMVGREFRIILEIAKEIDMCITISHTPEFNWNCKLIETRMNIGQFAPYDKKSTSTVDDFTDSVIFSKTFFSRLLLLCVMSMIQNKTTQHQHSTLSTHLYKRLQIFLPSPNISIHCTQILKFYFSPNQWLIAFFSHFLITKLSLSK